MFPTLGQAQNQITLPPVLHDSIARTSQGKPHRTDPNLGQFYQEKHPPKILAKPLAIPIGIWPVWPVGGQTGPKANLAKISY